MTQGNLAEILKLPHYLQPTDERQRQRVTVKKTLLVYWYTGYKLCGGCASTAGYGPAHFPPKKSLHSVQLPSSGWVRGAGSLWSCDTSFISSSSAATVSTRRVEGVRSLQAFSAYWWCYSALFLRRTECPQEERKGVQLLQPFSAYWWSRSAVFLRRTVPRQQCPQEKWRASGSSVNGALGAQGVGSLQAFSAYWWCQLLCVVGPCLNK